jgi:hypothetical protein
MFQRNEEKREKGNKSLSRKCRLRAMTLAICWSVFCVFLPGAAWADSAEAFMSATFGLSAARTQKRMERSGATAADFVREGRLTMKGTFEYRSALFIFGFHAKKGLNHKSVYIASSGNANMDRALYDGLREAYNARFGATEERATANARAKGRIMLRSTWKPNKDTIISLSYNPEVTNRFPGESPGDRPLHLIYNTTKWTK